MNMTQRLSVLAAAASLSLLVAIPAQAETYEGVQGVTSARSAEEVRSEAYKAAAAPSQNVPRGSRGAEAFTPSADPAAVRAQAIATANAPDQNVSSGSRYNSRVVSTPAARTQAAGAQTPGTVTK